MRGLIDILIFLGVALFIIVGTSLLAYFARGPLLLDIRPYIYVPLGVYIAFITMVLVTSRVPLSYMVGNLVIRWLTTSLTAMAFVLVIGLLTGLLAFVNGMYVLTQGSGHAENVLILSEGATDEGFSTFGYGDLGDIENQAGIERNENGKPLLSRETYLVVNQPINSSVPGRPKRRFLQMRGIDDPRISSTVHGLPLYPGGEWFSDAGVREVDGTAASQIEVVIGEGIARELAADRGLKERLETGDTFELNDRVWYVSGVMQSSGSTFDSEVWGKRALIGPLFGKESYSTLVARTASPAAAKALEKFFDTEYSKTAVASQVETDYFASLSETNKQFLVAILVITAFMAIGGVFGIMNTMFAAISLRIKDIGVMRLLGYKRRHILATFLLESVAIAIFGGILGCAVGMLSDGWTANSIVSSGQGGGGKFVVLKLSVDNQTIAFGMLLSLIMGVLGGLLPSLRAMRLTALETLR